MVGLEMLETILIYLCEDYNVVATWCHDCALSLGHYGSHERDWGAYTQAQELAKLCMKRCYIVGNTTYGNPGGVANSFNMPIGRYDWIQQLVTGLFTEPWTLPYPYTMFSSFISKSNKPQHKI